MDFENPKVYGDTSIFDDLLYSISHFDIEFEECRIYMKVSFSLNYCRGSREKRKGYFTVRLTVRGGEILSPDRKRIVINCKVHCTMHMLKHPQG